MRIDINLASQKYQDAREFYTLWGGALALVILITAGLGFLAWSNYKTTARDTRHIRELRDKIARLDEQRAQAEAVLNRPENKDVRDQSQFWNDVIDSKSFSWTQLFSDLEKIMPARAYVMSVQPKVTPEKRLQLKLVLVGEKFDDANDLLSKMEHSERFRLPELDSTAQRKLGSGQGAPSGYEFEIVTYYTPAAPTPQAAATSAKKGA
jgi:Tfp pilus assembly protein PilN